MKDIEKAGDSLANKSEASADDNSNLKFKNAYVPSGGSNVLEFVPTVSGTLTIYVTNTDSNWTSKDQSKKAKLTLSIDGAAATDCIDKTADGFSNKIAYHYTVKVDKDKSYKFAMSTGRFVLFGIAFEH